jgi:hypothetical protein
MKMINAIIFIATGGTIPLKLPVIPRKGEMIRYYSSDSLGKPNIGKVVDVVYMLDIGHELEKVHIFVEKQNYTK